MGHHSLAVRRTVALALLFAVICGALFGVGWPLWGGYDTNRREIAHDRENIARFSRLAADREPLRKQVGAMERRAEIKRYLLEEGSPSLAAAALQSRVKGLVAEKGGRLMSTNVLPAISDGPFQRIAINVRLSVSHIEMQAILYELERTTPYVRVDNLRVLAPRHGTRLIQSRGQAGSSGEMDVRFNLSGYLVVPSDDIPPAS